MDLNLKKIDVNKNIKDLLKQPVDPKLIKQRDGGGGKKLNYISGSTVTDILNTTFNYMWNWEVKSQWIQKTDPFFNKYSKAPKAQKTTYKGVEGAWEEQGSVANVLGTLTIFLQSEDGTLITIKKDGFGSKSVIGKQNEQESIFKAAGTDALKKAASLLGIGLSLYRDEEEQLYYDEISYENPWTTEATKEHQEDLNYLQEYASTFQVDDETMENVVYTITNEYQVTPDNISTIVTYLKENVKSE